MEDRVKTRVEIQSRAATRVCLTPHNHEWDKWRRMDEWRYIT